MAFLDKTPAQKAFDRLYPARNRLYAEARQLRESANGTVRPVALVSFVSAVQAFKTTWDEVRQVPNIADIAEAETGQDRTSIMDDYRAVRDAADAVNAWIVSNIEVSNRIPGWIRSGDEYEIVGYAGAQIDGLAALLDTLIAALEA